MSTPPPLPTTQGELRIGIQYSLTGAQRTAMRLEYGYLLDEHVECVDPGQVEHIGSQNRPEYSPHAGWIFPSEWEHREYIPPAFSDRPKLSRNQRVVRCDLHWLTTIEQNEEVMRDVRAWQQAQARAREQGAKKRTKAGAKAPTKKEETGRRRPKLELI